MTRAAFTLGLVTLLGVSLAGQPGQPAPAPARFLVVDVHASPPSATLVVRVSSPRNGRYEIRRATMVELIRTAYGVEPDKILGGPHWVELDRYDINAQVPAGTTRESLRPMLQALLADRFGLVVKQEIKPVAAHTLVRGPGELRLKESPGGVATTCQQNIQSAVQSLQLTMTCRGISMAAFAEQLTRSPGMAGITGPVVDSTGLPGSFDFDLLFAPAQLAALAGGNNRAPTFTEALKQLGLLLEAKSVPLPAITIEAVNRTPTPNDDAAVAKAFPPGPPPEFEVADVRPAAPQSRANMQIMPNGQVNITNIPLRTLIGLAWGASSPASIVGPAAALDKTYDLIGRVSTGPIDPAGVDREVIGEMIQKLLADALTITARWEERPAKGYSLVVDGSHKLIKATNPDARTRCTEVPGASAPGAASVPTRTLTCQNMTMAEFADRLQRLGAGAPNSPFMAPVLDETGLKDRWNFSMTFMIPGLSEALARARATAPPGAIPGGGGLGASDPTGAMTLEEAVERQLGLKLRERQRPARMLVVEVPPSAN